MRTPVPSERKLRAENVRLRTELHELEETLRAIREDSVDAFVIETSLGPQVFVLQGVDAESSLLRDGILASITDAVIVYGSDERVIYLNPAAADLYQVTPSDALGGLIDGLIRERWHDPEDAARKATALRDGGRWRGKSLHVTRAGESIPVEVTVSRLPVAGDQPPIWLAVVRTVSEYATAAVTQAQLDSQARELRRWEAIGALAARVADDVSAMRGPDTAVHMGPANLEAAMRRAQELQQRLLSFDGSRTSPRPIVSVAVIVKEVVRLLRVGLPKEIRIESSCATTTPLIRGDATQLMQALLHLGINAGHAMEERSGTLGIHAAGITVTETMARSEPGLRSGRFVRIEVRDTGHGMDAETQQRAFEPFFTRKPPEKGAGLGLAVVRRIIQGHQGIIVLHSALDLGSSFELYLPCTA